MNRNEMKKLMEAEGVRSDAYSISGQSRDDSLCLEVVPSGWSVYYSERGLRTAARFFETEEEACESMAQELLADLGNRIGVEPPVT